MVKRTAKSSGKHRATRFPKIVIYTTEQVVRRFSERAREQNRSVSGHGEFLVLQDLQVGGKQVA